MCSRLLPQELLLSTAAVTVCCLSTLCAELPLPLLSLLPLLLLLMARLLAVSLASLAQLLLLLLLLA